MIDLSELLESVSFQHKHGSDGDDLLPETSSWKKSTTLDSGIDVDPYVQLLKIRTATLSIDNDLVSTPIQNSAGVASKEVEDNLLATRLFRVSNEQVAPSFEPPHVLHHASSTISEVAPQIVTRDPLQSRKRSRSTTAALPLPPTPRRPSDAREHRHLSSQGHSDILDSREAQISPAGLGSTIQRATPPVVLGTMKHSSNPRLSKMEVRLEELRSPSGERKLRELMENVRCTLRSRRMRDENGTELYIVRRNVATCCITTAGIVKYRALEASERAKMRHRRALRVRLAVAAAEEEKAAAWRAKQEQVAAANLIQFQRRGITPDTTHERTRRLLTLIAAGTVTSQLFAALNVLRHNSLSSEFTASQFSQTSASTLKSWEATHVLRREAARMIQRWWVTRKKWTAVAMKLARKRMEEASDIVKMFLIDSEIAATVTCMFRFRRKVKNCQYHLHIFLEIRRHRLRLLMLLWAKVETKLKKKMRADLIRKAKIEEQTLRSIHEQVVNCAVTGPGAQKKKVHPPGKQKSQSADIEYRSVAALLNMRLKASIGELKNLTCDPHIRKHLLDDFLRDLQNRYRRSIPVYSVRLSRAAITSVSLTAEGTEITLDRARQWLQEWSSGQSDDVPDPNAQVRTLITPFLLLRSIPEGAMEALIQKGWELTQRAERLAAESSGLDELKVQKDYKGHYAWP